jgi:signal transduction histidine kinase
MKPIRSILILSLLSLLFSPSCRDRSSLGGSSVSEFVPEIAYFEDPTGTLTLADVLRDRDFKTVSTRNVGLGYTGSVYWFRFTIDYGSTVRQDVEEELYLEIGFPMLDRILFFHPVGDAYRFFEAGSVLPFEKRAVLHYNYIFPIQVAKSGRVDYYMRVSTEGSLSFLVDLYTKKEFIQTDRIRNFLFGLYYGIALTLILYNFLLFLTLKNKSYLFYVFWIFSFTSLQFVWNGLAFQLIWPDHPEITKSVLRALPIAILFSAMMFSVSFLEMRTRFRKIYDFYVACSIPVILTYLTLVAVSYTASLIFSGVASIVYIATVIAISALFLRRGLLYARFYFVSWIILLTGVAAVDLARLGLLPMNFFTGYGYQISSLFEMLFLSLALADRMRLHRVEMQRDLEESLSSERIAREALEKIQHDLEGEVHERTKELKIQKEKAEEAVILKDKFISIVSHDLKSPLLGVLAYLELLETGMDQKIDGATLKRIHGQLTDSIHGLLEMIDQLLNIGRLKSGQIHIEPEYFEARPLVDEALLLYSGFAEDKGILIRNEVPEGISLFADRILFKEVVQNLISNAIKFSKENESIRVFIPENAPTTIAVGDTGTGIDDEIIRKIFRHRSTTTLGTSKERGTGLGLLFCIDILEAHGGAMNVHSVPEGGSTFYATLPKAERIVLVIDDVEEVRRDLRAKLRLRDLCVVEAHDGAHTIEMLNHFIPDLIISDIHMPEIGGFELLTLLKKREKFANIPFVIMTSGAVLRDFNDREVEGLAKELGATEFFLKPIPENDLLSLVDRYLS